MWSGEDDYNDDGQAVRLYQPIFYGRKAKQDDLTCSFVGGSVPSSDNLACGSCKGPLYLLSQLFIPNSSTETSGRTLQVFACNRTSCITALFAHGKLASGGEVVVCRRYNVDGKSESQKEPDPSSQVDGKMPTSSSDHNEWAMDSAGGSSMDALEAKLAAMETASKPPVNQPKRQPSSAKSDSGRKGQSRNSFPCYLLAAQQETAAIRPTGTDEDDVGISGTDDKIQKMLARYMAEEDDEDILAALQNSQSGGASGFGGGRGEKDERLSAADRALLTFTDRLKRSPRQVIRCARGGEPMWSIPVEKGPQQARHKNQRSKTKTTTAPEPTVPLCSCGAKRVFEIQLLPSLLHVLQVDREVPISSGIEAAFNEGGMNWGNIGVYTCSKGCHSPCDYVLVQESVDEQPSEPKKIVQGDLVVKEDTKFDEDDFDDDDDDNDSNEEDEEKMCEAEDC